MLNTEVKDCLNLLFEEDMKYIKGYVAHWDDMSNGLWNVNDYVARVLENIYKNKYKHKIAIFLDKTNLINNLNGDIAASLNECQRYIYDKTLNYFKDRLIFFEFEPYYFIRD